MNSNTTEQQTPTFQVLTPEAQKIVHALGMMDLSDLPFHLRNVHDHCIHHSTENLDEPMRTSLYFVNQLAMAMFGSQVFKK